MQCKWQPGQEKAIVITPFFFSSSCINNNNLITRLEIEEMTIAHCAICSFLPFFFSFLVIYSMQLEIRRRHKPWLLLLLKVAANVCGECDKLIRMTFLLPTAVVVVVNWLEKTKFLSLISDFSFFLFDSFFLRLQLSTFRKLLFSF